jgi:hypothetical protein
LQLASCCSLSCGLAACSSLNACFCCAVLLSSIWQKREVEGQEVLGGIDSWLPCLHLVPLLLCVLRFGGGAGLAAVSMHAFGCAMLLALCIDAALACAACYDSDICLPWPEWPFVGEALALHQHMCASRVTNPKLMPWQWQPATAAATSSQLHWRNQFVPCPIISRVAADSVVRHSSAQLSMLEVGLISQLC